ncbi:MAG: CHAT domain-containing protein, partial [Rhodopirellula sp. JB044]|uniref:CHAT domain-containing protein n=1 Tax=Rhodopirellula sp. JB044 TaxID=3342844 RepID=UPI00370CF5DB
MASNSCSPTVNKFRFLIVVIAVLFASDLAAQVFVVQTDDARFMDGTKTVATVPRGYELYALDVRDDWLLAVEPRSLTRYWVSKSNTKRKTLADTDQQREERLWEQVSGIETIVNSGTATTAQVQQALDCSNQLRQIWKDKHPHAATALQYSGLVAANAGAFTQAEKILKETLDVHQKLYGKESLESAEILLDLAHLANDQLDGVRAAKLARRAWQINHSALGAKHPNTLAATFPIAFALESIQEYEDALQIYQSAYDAMVNNPGTHDFFTIQTHAKVARLNLKLDRRQKAISIYQTVVDSLKKHHPDRFKEIALQELRLASAKLDTDDPVSMATFAKSVADLERRFPELIIAIQAEQELLLANYLIKGETRQAFAIVDSQLRQMRSTLRKELWGMNAKQQSDYLARADGYRFFASVALAVDFSHIPSVVSTSAEWLINGKGLVEEAQSVQEGAVLDLQKRETWANQPWVSCQDLRDALDDNEAYVDVLSYLDFDFDAQAASSATIQRYGAWILTKQSDARFLDLGPASTINTAVAKLLQGMNDSVEYIPELGPQAAFEKLKPQLSEVSRLVWHPIRQACGERTNIIISPDQELWLVPWHALLNRHDETFVAETHAIRLQLSGRELVQSTENNASNPAVIFADPNYDA